LPENLVPGKGLKFKRFPAQIQSVAQPHSGITR
jgi:hypothetical protein